MASLYSTMSRIALNSSIVVVPFTFIAGGLVWAMYGATDIAGVIVFGIFYGFFSGGCKFLVIRYPMSAADMQLGTVISLVNPVAATCKSLVLYIGQ
jgi:hypothetical protein